MLQTEFYCFPL